MLYRITDDETIIGLPPGIGDIHWVMAIMESFKKKNNIKKLRIRMNLGRQENKNYHDCSVEYLALLPFIDSAETVMPDLPFEFQITGGSGKPFFKNIGGCDYLIEFNSRLEQGVKLKDILPEYKTNFDYPIDRPPASEVFAANVKRAVGEKLVLFFAASIGGNKTWVNELWTEEHWMELARKIYDKTGCRCVLIGARWDKAYARRLHKLDGDNIIHDIVGKTPVAHLFALIRAANVIVAFQCGIVMMATRFRTPVAGFWAIKSKANPKGVFKRVFMRSWLPPWTNDDLMPFGWGDENATPNGVFDAIRRYL